ncbi:MAG: SAM-dependent methyltransferase, partial [Pseudoxanthomonas sp.]
MSSVVRTTSGASFDVLDRFLRGRLLRQLDALHGGEIALDDAFGTTVVGESGHGPAIRLHVHDAGFYRALAGNGSVGAAEAFIDGHWDCSDLVGLVRLLVRNRDLLDCMEGGPARLGGWAVKAWHALRR